MEEDWTAVGLSDFDGIMYRRIVRAPTDGVGTHAEALACSPARVRRSVARLLGAGLLRATPRQGTGAEPVDPRTGLGLLVRDRRAALDGIAVAADQMARDYTAGQLLAEPERLLEVVSGRDATVARIDDLLRGASVEAVGTDAPPYVADGSADVHEAEVALLGRGVRFRALYAAEVLEHPRLVARIAQMVERGEQARVLPTIPIKLLVVDAATAVIPLAREARTPSSASGAEHAEQARTVVVSESALTGAVQALFELMWAQATPLRFGRDATPSRDPGMSADTSELVNLLATGMTDDAMARYLGVSARTLRRRIAALHDALDATGRFQAGMQAAQRGWV